ncbi:granzyme B(G,H)-like [Brachyhypopomus gauderio]|uniref:granzyme B(G,H)-like n=1 Tax=Brachyhypopomus gauderio TaxID=698409 RepID=UPI004041350A
MCAEIHSLSVCSTNMFFCLFVLQISPLAGAMETTIVGGHEAVPHSIPSLASVQLNKQHKCGGMLIRNDTVLTAAHCGDSTCSKLEVVLGAHDIKAKEFGQQRIKVQKCIKHPSYVQNEFHHDVMLLKLKTKAKMNKFVRVIDLPKKNNDIPANQNCSIAGWGMKVPKGSGSSVLQEVKLKLQFNFECKNIWQKYFDSSYMICTVSNGKTAFCQGDSGSPLICNNKPQGLASYTFKGDCTNRKYPEVYMKISYFTPWIKEVMG